MSFAERMRLLSTGIADGKQRDRLQSSKKEWLIFIEEEANKGKSCTRGESFGGQDVRPDWEKLLIPLLEEEGLKITYSEGDVREPYSISYHTISWS